MQLSIYLLIIIIFLFRYAFLRYNEYLARKDEFLALTATKNNKWFYSGNLRIQREVQKEMQEEEEEQQEQRNEDETNNTMMCPSDVLIYMCI